MEMCYDGALVMPSSYAMMTEDEMTYVEGGAETEGYQLNGWAKALVVGVVAVASVAVLTAIATGTIAIAIAGFATVMKYGIMGTLISYIGAKAAVTTVLTCMGASATLVATLVAKFA